MREPPDKRLKRLRDRKVVLLGKMKFVGSSSTIRNAEHKRTILNDEVNQITVKIMELEERRIITE